MPIKVFNLDLGDSLSYRFIAVAPCKIHMIKKNVIRLTSERVKTRKIPRFRLHTCRALEELRSVRHESTASFML